MLVDRKVKQFLAVAEAGSISAAARALYISQPALSAQIRLLEHEVGFSLFERTPTGVVLTERGRLFRHDMAELCRIEHAALERAKVSPEPPVDVVIGFVAPSEAHALTDVIAWFQEQRPGSSIAFRLIPQDLSARKRLVLEKEVDCAFAAMRPSDMVEGLGFEAFHPDDECLVVSPLDPLASRELVGAQDLSGRTVSIPKEGEASSLITGLCRELCEENPSITLAERVVDPAFIESLRYAADPFLTTQSIARMLEGVAVVPLRHTCPNPQFGMLYASEPGACFARFAAQHYAG